MPITGNRVTGLSPFDQSLASVPDLTKRTYPSDGLESTGHAMQRAQLPGLTDASPTTGDTAEGQEPQRPTLATITDPKLLYRAIDGLARSQDPLAANRWAIDLYARRIRANVPFSTLEKLPNVAQWVAKLPNGITRERMGSTPNKADDLCNKVVSTLEADPMRPDPISHTDDESSEQAQALAGEFLRSVMGESGINWEDKHRWALDVALTCASAFLHYDVDPHGGGSQPEQILAHPKATDPTNPDTAVDQQTGLPEPTVDPILRYVSVDGTQFVDDPSQAGRVWIPSITCDRLRREQVRMYPPTADVETAKGVLLILWCTIQEAMDQWPEVVGQMSSTDLASLASWRPSSGPDRVVPFALRAGLADGQSGPGVDDVGSFSPLLQRRMFYYRFYAAESFEYPQGCQIDIHGWDGGTILGQKDLSYQVTLPNGGTDIRVRELPLEQIRPCQDVDGGDPMGWAFLHRVAGSSEAEQMLYAAYQDAINLRLNPHVFIRSNVAVTEDDWADRTTPIILGPADHEPTYEQFPAMPNFLDMIENVDRKMDSAASLGETGQSLQTNGSISGVARQIAVQTANKDLSGMLGQLNSAKTRGCRILVQLAQSDFKVPQLMQYTGEDGSVQAEWWTGENLAGIDDIGIEPGTGTTMTPEGKAQLAQFAQNAQWLSPQDAAKVGLAGITRDLGLPPDPVMEAIERSVGAWLKGPPKGWDDQWNQYAPLKAQYDQAMQQFTQMQQLQQAYLQAQAIVMAGPPSGMLGPEGQEEDAAKNYQFAVETTQMMLSQNPAIAAPLQPPQIQLPPAPWTPFIARPNDTEPSIATKWEQRLSVAMMNPEYTRWSTGWVQQLNDKYTMVRQAVATAAGAQAATGGSTPNQQQMASRQHQPGASKPQSVKATLPQAGQTNARL